MISCIVELGHEGPCRNWALNDIVNWHTRGIIVKSFDTIWTIINLQKMTSKSWVNWPKCVHKWFCHACISHEAGDQVFYCHLLELSQNGTERAPRGWRDWEVVVNTLRIKQTSSCRRQSQWMQTWFISRRWIFDRFRVNIMWNALVYLVMTLLCLVHEHAKTDGSVTQHHGSWRDTSPRMARLLASMLWDIVIDVLELYASRARADPSRPLQTAEAIQECMDQQIVFGYFFLKTIRLLSRNFCEIRSHQP